MPIKNLHLCDYIIKCRLQYYMLSIKSSPVLRIQKKINFNKKVKRNLMKAANTVSNENTIKIINPFRKILQNQILEQSFLPHQIKINVISLEYLSSAIIKSIPFPQIKQNFSQSLANMQQAIKRQQKQIQQIIYNTDTIQCKPMRYCLQKQDFNEQEIKQRLFSIKQIDQVSLNLNQYQEKEKEADDFDFKDHRANTYPNPHWGQQFKYYSENNILMHEADKNLLDNFFD